MGERQCALLSSGSQRTNNRECENVRETTITPIVHVQLVGRQELLQAEMLIMPGPHKLEPTEECRATLKRRVVYEPDEILRLPTRHTRVA